MFGNFTTLCMKGLTAYCRKQSLREKILRISPYSVRMQENTDQKNSVFGHFSRSELFQKVPP